MISSSTIVKALRHLPALLASSLSLIALAIPLRAQTSVTSGTQQASSAGYVTDDLNSPWTFSNSSVLRITAAGAVNGGSATFNNTSQINAHVAGAITGGEQDFYDTSSLQITVDGTDAQHGILVGGEQYFYDNSLLKAGKQYAISGGYQVFNDVAVLTASADHAITGGEQDFYSADDASPNFQANARLVANQTNAVAGGSQYFMGYTSLQANATHAVLAANISLYDEALVNVGRADALTSGVNIYFGGDEQFEDSTGGILRLNGNSTSVGEISSSGNFGLIENGSASNATLTVDFASCTSEFSGYIRDGNDTLGDLALVKTGSGKLVLSGSYNDYSGGTTINGGTLVAAANYTLGNGNVNVNNGGTLTVKNSELGNLVCVNNGGTLNGNGLISNGRINAGGTLSPGTANCPIGELDFGDLTLAGMSTLVIGVKSDGEGVLENSTIDVQNTETLDISSVDSSNPLTLKLVSQGLLGGLIAGHQYSITFITFDHSNGADLALYSSLLLDTTGFNTGFGAVTYTLVGGEGDGLYTLNFTPVPEPSTYALLGLGLGLSGFAAWRKRSRD